VRLRPGAEKTEETAGQGRQVPAVTLEHKNVDFVKHFQYLVESYINTSIVYLTTLTEDVCETKAYWESSTGYDKRQTVAIRMLWTTMQIQGYGKVLWCADVCVYSVEIQKHEER